MRILMLCCALLLLSGCFARSLAEAAQLSREAKAEITEAQLQAEQAMQTFGSLVEDFRQVVEHGQAAIAKAQQAKEKYQQAAEELNGFMKTIAIGGIALLTGGAGAGGLAGMAARKAKRLAAQRLRERDELAELSPAEARKRRLEMDGGTSA
jgi:ABC-type transporter Mla subunit MlaD